MDSLPFSICIQKDCLLSDKVFNNYTSLREHAFKKCDLQDFKNFCNSKKIENKEIFEKYESLSQQQILNEIDHWKNQMMEDFKSLLEKEVEITKNVIYNFYKEQQQINEIFQAIENQDEQYINYHYNSIFALDHSKILDDINSLVSGQFSKLDTIKNQIKEKIDWSDGLKPNQIEIEKPSEIHGGNGLINFTLNEKHNDIQLEEENFQDEIFQLHNNQQFQEIQPKKVCSHLQQTQQIENQKISQQPEVQIWNFNFPSGFQFLSLIEKDTLEDSIYGCMFGQIIGDALGSYLEFTDVTPGTVQQALEMPGGGVFHLKPGQVTDDSDMALCILRGLNTNYQHQGLYPLLDETSRILELIALELNGWFNSNPVDVGQSTQLALNITFKKGSLYSALMIDSAKTNNYLSLSNGSLMRSSSLAIYCALKKFNFKDVQKFVSKESSLTHSHPCVQATTTLWVYTVQQLILNHHLDLAKRVKKVLQLLQENYEKFYLQNEVQGLKQMWERFQSGDLPDPKVSIGYLGIPWIRGLVLLRNILTHPIQSFKDLMEEVLNWGGDTDTNACIIGSLFGCLLGFNHFKNNQKCQTWVEKTLNCTEREKFKSNQLILETQKLINLIQNQIKTN